MKKIILLFLPIILLSGCKNENSSTISSLKSEISDTAEISEEVTTHNMTKKQPYGLQAPNAKFNNLVVMGGINYANNTNGKDTRGENYLEENGYRLINNVSDSYNDDHYYISEISSVLPNATNAYGEEIYYYFWCNDNMKKNLGKVRIDGDIIFYEATEEYLNSIRLESDNQNYKNQSNKDLNIEEINNNNLASLVGTWKNGLGDTIQVNSDGTTNLNLTVHGVENSDKTSKIPYARLSDGVTGSALGLFKIGFENPNGDNSDISRPRILITQQGGSYSPDAYYYRQ